MPKGHPPVIPLNAIVEIPRSPMLDIRQDCPESRWVTLRFVRRDSLRPYGGLSDSSLEERSGWCSVATRRKVDVNNLTVLIYGLIEVGPPPVEAAICLIDSPLCTDWVSMGTGSFLEQRGCPPGAALDPAIDRAPVNDEAALREPLDDIRIAQPVADVPADRQGDHVIREGMVGCPPGQGARRTGGEPTLARVAPPALAT